MAVAYGGFGFFMDGSDAEVLISTGMAVSVKMIVMGGGARFVRESAMCARADPSRSCHHYSDVPGVM